MFTALHRGGSGPPLLLLHGFTDTWRTWELVLPALEERHDVLAPTLAGHAGGPPLVEPVSADAVLDEVEQAMDAAGFATAHVAGNSLGGYLALKLAERGRARSVVALAPAGGWAPGDPALAETLAFFTQMQDELRLVAPHVAAALASPEGRRRATQFISTNYEHLPADLLVHQLRGVLECDVGRLVAAAERDGYDLDARLVTCPVRIVWGTSDALLGWPSAAHRFRHVWLPHADWVELDGIGHCPQLDVPLETAQLILGWAAD